MASKTDEELASQHLARTIQSLSIPVIKDRRAAEVLLFEDADD